MVMFVCVLLTGTILFGYVMRANERTKENKTIGTYGTNELGLVLKIPRFMC